jgi:hypothetical protein
VGTEDDDPRTVEDLRPAGFVALGLLLVLNVVDVVVTRMLLDRGGVELNPLADRLLASNTALVAKVGVVVALVIRLWHHPPRLLLVCFMWLVVGVYLLVVIVNGSQLANRW